MDVRGGVRKVFGVSVCVFPSIRHDRKVTTHSSCSHFVRLLLPVRMLRLLRLVRLLTLVRLAATNVNADISVTCHTIDG